MSPAMEMSVTATGEPRQRRRVKKDPPKTLSLKIKVTQADIDGGVCRDANRCMEKVAVFRTLVEKKLANSNAEARVRVDAGHVRFNVLGWRWKGDSPKVAKHCLIQYDLKGPAAVQPHEYTLTMTRVCRIVPTSPERQAQVNEARRQRILSGDPDKPYTRKTLRERIVGFA